MADIVPAANQTLFPQIRAPRAIQKIRAGAPSAGLCRWLTRQDAARHAPACVTAQKSSAGAAQRPMTLRINQ